MLPEQPPIYHAIHNVLPHTKKHRLCNKVTKNELGNPRKCIKKRYIEILLAWLLMKDDKLVAIICNSN